MNEKIIKIIFVIFGIFFLVILFFVFDLNRKINVITTGRSGNSSSQMAKKTADEMKNLKLDRNVKKIMGKITEKGDGYFAISYNIPDLTKPKSKDASAMQNTISSDDFEKITKNIRVDVNENTVFVSKKFVDFQVGMMIDVEADKSVIDNDEVLAVKISEPKAK